MKKFIITSNIMKKAHLKTKIMKKTYPEINYRTQLGLEISNLLKEERQSFEENTLRIKTINKIMSVVKNCNNSNAKIWGNDLNLLDGMFRRDLSIMNFSFMKSYTPFTLAVDLINRYRKNVRRYA